MLIIFQTIKTLSLTLALATPEPLTTDAAPTVEATAADPGAPAAAVSQAEAATVPVADTKAEAAQTEAPQALPAATKPPSPAAAPATATPTRAFPRLRAQAELHGSFLSDAADRSLLGDTLGYGVRAAYFHWQTVGLVLHLEHNLWFSRELNRQLTPGSLNLGAGATYLYFDQRMQASLVLGLSILLFETALDRPGSVGLFIDARPTTIRWPLLDWLTVKLDPISFGLVAPVLTGIPLVIVEFRTTLAAEFNLL